MPYYAFGKKQKQKKNRKANMSMRHFISELTSELELLEGCITFLDCFHSLMFFIRIR